MEGVGIVSVNLVECLKNPAVLGSVGGLKYVMKAIVNVHMVLIVKDNAGDVSISV